MNLDTTAESPEELLAHLASRLKTDAAFMAGVLAIYQEQEGLTERELSESLGLSDLEMARLSLCKRPDTAERDFADQVRQISNYVSADALKIANMIRQVEATQQFKTWAQTEIPPQEDPRTRALPAGLLSAARDRAEEDVDEQVDDMDQQPNNSEDDDVA